MYINRLRLQNIRLLADETLSFEDGPGGKPRLWTAIVGENGLCKSTILQSIALAALGPTLATAVAQDSQRFRAAGSDDRSAVIQATFEDDAGVFSSRLTVHRGRHDFEGGGRHDGNGPRHRSGPRSYDEPFSIHEEPGEDYLPPPPSRGDPDIGTDFISDVRARRTPGWFLVGYGVGRYLAAPGEVSPLRDPIVDRVRGLFDPRHKMLGLNFSRAFSSQRHAMRFGRTLRTVLRTAADGGELLPGFLSIDLKTVETVSIRVGERNLHIPAGWLSDGHQAVIAWIADLLGHAMFESAASGDPAELEGIVLLDEIDLHLHPTWQRQIVSLLRRAFPRLQFVVTTHSPLVLGAFDRSEIIRLRLDGGTVVQDPAAIEPGVLTASETLTSYFSVAQAGRPDLVAKERRYRELLALTRPN